MVAVAWLRQQLSSETFALEKLSRCTKRMNTLRSQGLSLGQERLRRTMAFSLAWYLTATRSRAASNSSTVQRLRFWQQLHFQSTRPFRFTPHGSQPAER